MAEETAWKNCWNWNLPDAAFGSLVLDVRDGRIGCEMKSQGTILSLSQLVFVVLGSRQKIDGFSVFVSFVNEM